jgi:hypothetical protein
VRQIDFGDWCGWAFSTPATLQPPSLVSPDALFRCRRRVPSPFLGFLLRSPTVRGYAGQRGRRPSRFPRLCARARPDLTRSMIIARSNSAKTPKNLIHRLSGWRVVRIGFRRCSAEFQFPSPSLKAVTVQTGIVLSSAFVVSRPNCSSIPAN